MRFIITEVVCVAKAHGAKSVLIKRMPCTISRIKRKRRLMIESADVRCRVNSCKRKNITDTTRCVGLLLACI